MIPWRGTSAWARTFVAFHVYMRFWSSSSWSSVISSSLTSFRPRFDLHRPLHENSRPELLIPALSRELELHVVQLQETCEPALKIFNSFLQQMSSTVISNSTRRTRAVGFLRSQCFTLLWKGFVSYLICVMTRLTHPSPSTVHLQGMAWDSVESMSHTISTCAIHIESSIYHVELNHLVLKVWHGPTASGLP